MGGELKDTLETTGPPPNRVTGTVDISLTDTQTATFETDTLSYDVMLEDSNGLREYYLEGVITMSEGYTTP